MYLVRNVFKAKPGKAKALVETFRKASQVMSGLGVVKSTRILTDSVAGFWTIVLEDEVEDLNAYMDMAKSLSGKPEFAEVVKNYVEYSLEGYREVFKIE